MSDSKIIAQIRDFLKSASLSGWEGLGGAERGMWGGVVLSQYRGLGPSCDTLYGKYACHECLKCD